MKSYTIYLMEWLERDTWREASDKHASLINDIRYYLQFFGYNVITKLANNSEFKGKILSSRSMFIVQNNDTKQYFLIDMEDSSYVNKNSNNESSDLLSNPLCVGVLKCQYLSGRYDDCEGKVSPWIYIPSKPDILNEIRHEIMETKPDIDKMYFRGQLEMRARFLIVTELNSIGILSDDFHACVYKRRGGIRFWDYDEYLLDMRKHKISLSLPGAGLSCYREIESFGIGVPVLMPRHKNLFYNDLVPDKHYISFDHDFSSIPWWLRGSNCVDFKTFLHFYRESKVIVEKIKNRYNEVIHDEDFLKYISDNALKWFEENVLFPQNVKIAEKILLDKFNYKLLY